MGFYLNEEARVHLNLSNHAWHVLRDDMFNFYRDDIENYSGFINDIILYYYQEAEASIQIRCDVLAAQYEELFSNKTINMDIDPSFEYSVIDAITKSFKAKAINKINSYPKDGYKKIKLRQNVVEIMEESAEDPFYDGVVGNYIKAIVEEYTRLPFLKREAIISKNNVESINKGINRGKCLKVNVRSGKVFEVIPYKILTGRLGMFNYLVGIDCSTKLPVSYRISKAKIKVISKPGKIDSNLQELIENKLLVSDVSFITKDNVRIVIELDEYGIQNYNSQLHMRPIYTEIIDHNKYVFNCSIDQAKYYFRKFGSSVKVLEPESLANSFRGFYKYALDRYEDDDSHNN